MTSPVPPISIDPTDYSADAANTLAGFRVAMELAETAVHQVKEAWTAFTSAMQAVLNKLQHELNSDSIWSTVVEWFVDDIKDCMQLIQDVVAQIKTKVEDFLTKMEEAVRGSAPVLSMIDTAVRYNPHVIAPFTDIGTSMEAKGDVVWWVGATKEAYVLRVKEQTEAVTATTGKLVATSAWLANAGAANLTYMTDTGKKSAEVVGALTTACIDAGMSVSGLVTQVPLTLKDLAEVVGEAVNQLIQYGLDLANYLVASVTRVNELSNQASNYDDLGSGGTWPTIGD